MDPTNVQNVRTGDAGMETPGTVVFPGSDYINVHASVLYHPSLETLAIRNKRAGIRDPEPTPLWTFQLPPRSVETHAPLRKLTMEGYSIQSMIPALDFFSAARLPNGGLSPEEMRNSKTLRHRYYLPHETLDRAFRCLLPSPKILHFTH